MTVLSGGPGARTMSKAYRDHTMLIDRFEGQHGWLSNFHTHRLMFGGVEFGSVEHLFNASKSLDRTEREHVRAAPTPAEAKRRGRRVTLRPRWDEQVRYDAMRMTLRAKFEDPELRARLLATGDALLIEGNRHHDQHWGDCNCDEHRAWPGRNHLGRTLMAVRAELAGHPADRWTRVMVTGHRPQHLSDEQAAWAQGELDRLAVKVRDEHHAQVAITGAALGADTWWARSARRAGLRLWAYVPCLTQSSRWRPEDQETWRRMLGVAERTLVLADDYDVRLLHARNGFMVRDADLVIAVWDPAKTTGGTAAAVNAARAAGKTIVVVDVAAQRTRIERPARG